jgi:hypothetical protein
MEPVRPIADYWADRIVHVIRHELNNHLGILYRLSCEELPDGHISDRLRRAFSRAFSSMENLAIEFSGVSIARSGGKEFVEIGDVMQIVTRNTAVTNALNPPIVTIASQTPPVEADRALLAAVLANIIMNSYEAAGGFSAELKRKK